MNKRRRYYLMLKIISCKNYKDISQFGEHSRTYRAFAVAAERWAGLGNFLFTLKSNNNYWLTLTAMA